MAKDTLLLVPDKPGKGGSKFSVPSIYPVLDIHGNANAMVYAGKWQNFPGDRTTPWLTGQLSDATKKLHVYYLYDSTNANAAPQYRLLGHHYQSVSGDKLWDYTYGRALNAYVGGLGFTRDVQDSSGMAVPAKFVNVKNRCFIAWGVNAFLYWHFNLIYDGNVNSTAVPMGVPAPTPVISYTLQTGYSGTIWATANSQYLTYNWDPTQSGTWPNANGSYVLTAGGDSYSGDAVAYAGGGPPPVATDAQAGTWAYGATQQTLTVTGAVIDKLKYLGCTLYNAGNANIGIIASVTTNANGLDSTVNLTKVSATAIGAGPWKITKPMFTIASGKVWGQTTGSASTQAIPFTMASAGALTWGPVAPRYSYARYNPTTGHVSNIGPICTITETNQTVSSITLQIPVDGTNNDYYKAGYTKVIVFRSQINGNNQLMLPLGDFTSGTAAGYLDNYPTASPTTSGFRQLVDNNADDVLLQGFAAPQVFNRQPPVYSQMAYWDGKIWGVPYDDQQIIQYSADPTQVGFGVIEECAPSENVLFLPTEDGRVVGMKTVGSLLIITTQKSAYYISGQGTSYRLVRLTSAMAGVGNEQFCEWVGEAGDESVRIGFIGTDGKIYRLTPFGGNECLSYPVTLGIEQFFGGTYDYNTARIHQIITKGFRLLMIRPPTQNYGDTATLYAFDYENQTWHSIYTNNVSGDCFVTGYVDKYPPVQVLGYHGYAFFWCDWSFGEGVASPRTFLRTFPFDAGNIEDFKQFDSAKIYVSDANLTGAFGWTGTLTVDNETVYTLTFVPYNDIVRNPFPVPGADILGGLGSPGNAQGNLIAYGPASSDGPIVGHRFQLVITWPDYAHGNTGIYGLYGVAVDLNPVEAQEAQGTQMAGG